MSNWAIVIVAWASTDRAAEHEGHRNRVKRLNPNRYRKDEPNNHPWQYVEPCSSTALGGACEVVAVTHCNHFQPDCSDQDWYDPDENHLADQLRAMAWEYPEQVCIMWKDEHMIGYSTLYPLREKGDTSVCREDNG